MIVGQPFTGTFTVNPNFLPLPTLTAFNNTNWGAAFTAAPSTSTNLNHSTSALPTGITLTAPSAANGFSDPENPNYGTFTISGTPTTPIASKVVYLYFGTGSNTGGTNVRTRYASMVLDFAIAGNYILDLNYTDSVDSTVSYIPGEDLMIPNPVREGFVFAGWYSDELTTTKAPLVAGTNASTTLYARWIDITDTQAVLAELALQASDLLNRQFIDQADLDAQVETIMIQVNSILSRLTTAETSVSQIPSIQSSITAITQSLIALTGDVDEEFAALADYLDDMFYDIDLRFADATSALDAARLALEEAINDGDEASAAALTTAIATLEAAIEQGDETLANSIATSVASLTALIDAANGRIDANEDAIADLLDELEAAQQALTDLEGQLGDTDAALAAAQARIDALEAALEAAQEAIEALQVVPETGCGSAINASSTLFITLSLLLGAALIVFIKKRS
jgi:uncharacterized repeat protein (TIGR02543 family)